MTQVQSWKLGHKQCSCRLHRARAAASQLVDVRAYSRASIEWCTASRLAGDSDEPGGQRLRARRLTRGRPVSESHVHTSRERDPRAHVPVRQRHRLSWPQLQSQHRRLSELSAFTRQTHVDAIDARHNGYWRSDSQRAAAHNHDDEVLPHALFLDNGAPNIISIAFSLPLRLRRRTPYGV